MADLIASINIEIKLDGEKGLINKLVGLNSQVVSLNGLAGKLLFVILGPLLTDDNGIRLTDDNGVYLVGQEQEPAYEIPGGGSFW